jgi:hypothetical protein
VVPRQVFSDYFGFPANTGSSDCSEVSTISQIVADVPSGLSLTPHHETKKGILLSEITDAQAFIRAEGSSRVFLFFRGEGLTSPGTAATSGLLYSPR